MSETNDTDAIDRFSPRAGEYSRHRPDYPIELLDHLVIGRGGKYRSLRESYG